MRALESLDRGKEKILMTVKSLLNPDQQFVCQELRWRAYEGEPKWHKIDNLLTTHFTPALCLFELIMSAIVTQRFRSVFRSRGWQPVHWFLQGACQIGIKKKGNWTTMGRKQTPIKFTNCFCWLFSFSSSDDDTML